MFITFRVKQYASIFEPDAEQEDGDTPLEDDPQQSHDTSSVLAVLMCRAEADHGIPEVVINGQFTYCTDMKHHFTGADRM